VEGDAAPGEPPRPLPAQRHLGPFGLRVGGNTAVPRRGHLQGSGVKALGVHAARGDSDHPGRSGGQQRGHHQAGEQERGDHLAQDGQLGPGRVGAELAVDRACVVDEYIEPVVGGAEIAGEGADRAGVLKIG
jgi:hypothetical protein